MTEANPKEIAAQNLLAFQDMSYADIYSLINQKRFREARAKYAGVLQNTECRLFDAALGVTIITPHDDLLECMSGMALKAAEPEKIKAVSFDLSAHTIHKDQVGELQQGIEVCLYSQDTYDFENASDEDLTDQCERPVSNWQGNFLDVESVAFSGLSKIVSQFNAYTSSEAYSSEGVIETQQGNVIVDPNAIAYHIAKLLVAIEYHRYMADFVAEVEVPSQMIFIIGEHDEIEVPIIFYRVGVEEPAIEAMQEVEIAAKEQMQHAESTPSIYDGSHEEITNEEATILAEEPKEEIGSNIGKKLYATAQAHIKVQTQTPKKASAETRNGLPLEARTFGQLNNSTHNDDFLEIKQELDEIESL